MIDTRFLVEYYYSNDLEVQKKAKQKMAELTRCGEGIIPSIVVCETVQLVCSREGKQNADMIYLSIIASGIKVDNLTPTIAKQAGVLKSTYRQVPVGDCIIAATAQAHNAKVISDDIHFDLIREIKRTWL